MKAEPIIKASQAAALVVSDLQNALKSATAMEALLLMPLIDQAARTAQQVEAMRAAKGATQITLDARGVTRLDSGGAALLVSLAGEEAEWQAPEDANARAALERTMGVPIFQEQVMQLAILAADFTPGEADQLRRAMAAWKRKGGLGPFHERLVGRMVAKGYEPAYAERIFKQIEGFGEYGFPESHAASFAILVYDSSWVKHHYPEVFAAALLNSQPMGFYAPAQLVRDAREHGVEVRPPCINASQWDNLMEPDGAGGLALRLGFRQIKGMGEEEASALLKGFFQARR